MTRRDFLGQSQYSDAIAAQAFDMRRSDEASSSHTYPNALFRELLRHELCPFG